MSDGRFKDTTVFIRRAIAKILTLGPFGPPGTLPRINFQYLETGTPNGVTEDHEGSFVVTLNPVGLWQKLSGGFSRTGWVAISGGGAQGDDLAYGLRVVGLQSGAQVGSTDVTVLRFANQGTPVFSSLPLADWVVQTNDPEDGTTFRLTLPGKYIASLSVPAPNAGQPINGGISLDASGIILTGLPLMGFQSSVLANMQNPDGNPATPSCAAPIFVTQEMIDDGLGVVRAHAENGAQASTSHTGFVLYRMGSARQA